MMSEINVTPLVDVMLVLLIIFMISSSIETLQVQQEYDRIEKAEDTNRLDQSVPVSLPRTDAEPVNLATERKLVLTITENADFFVNETKILQCLDLAPKLKDVLKGGRRSWSEKEDLGFDKCLDALVAKLGSNAKLQEDKEMYLRADESLPYGLTLKVMSGVRASGVAKFGLVAQPEDR